MTAVAVERAGVDTFSPAWYVGEGSPAARALESLASIRAHRAMLVPDKVGGCRFGWFPESRLAFFEGHPNPNGLAAADELAPAVFRLMEAADDFGVPLPFGSSRFSHAGSVGFAGMRRLDLTCDLRFERPVEGAAVLAGVAAMLGRHAVLHRHGSRLETVYLMSHAGKSVLGRWYDKGVESGTARPGVHIRPEDQRRFRSGSRRDVDEITAGWCRERFQKRFRPLWQASKGVTVGGPLVLAEKLAQEVEAKRITRRQAEILAGYVVCEAVGLHPSRATGYKRRARLRDLGLVASGQGLDEVEVDLSAVLEAVLDAPGWG